MDEERSSVVRGSGNVFADLGLPNPEGLLRRAERLGALRDHLRRRRLSTQRAMALLAATSEEVAWLRRGRFSGASEERVGEMFARLPPQAP